MNEIRSSVYMTTRGECECDLPAVALQLRVEEGVLEVKGHALSCRRFLRDFGQAEHHPRVHFSEAELAGQGQRIHGPAISQERCTFVCGDTHTHHTLANSFVTVAERI